MAQDFAVEGTQGLKKQDLIFALLSGIADKKFEVHAEGVMELLVRRLRLPAQRGQRLPAQPGRHLRVARRQVRRFNLRPGDTVYGPIRQPREGERFFALQKVDKVNFVDPGSRRGPGADPLRQPHSALPDAEAEARARRVGDDDPHHRHVLPHRAGAALPHRGAAEGRQDGAAAEHRARHRPEPPRDLPHRAAGGRAPGGSDGHGAQRARRGGVVAPSTSRPPVTCRSRRW